MKWTTTQFIKIIHPETFENLPDLPITGKLELGGSTYVPVRNLLPLILSWRYRLYEGEIAVFSCIGESRYLLEFELTEDPTKDLYELLNHSHMNFHIEWERAIDGTKLEGQHIPTLMSETRFNKTMEIMDSARQCGLLTLWSRQ